MVQRSDGGLRLSQLIRNLCIPSKSWIFRSTAAREACAVESGPFSSIGTLIKTGWWPLAISHPATTVKFILGNLHPDNRSILQSQQKHDALRYSFAIPNLCQAYHRFSTLLCILELDDLTRLFLLRKSWLFQTALFKEVYEFLRWVDSCLSPGSFFTIKKANFLLHQPQIEQGVHDRNQSLEFEVKFSVACMRGVGTAITGVFYWQSGFVRDPEIDEHELEGFLGPRSVNLLHFCGWSSSIKWKMNIHHWTA